MFKILPYKIGSASAKKLKEELNAVFIKLKDSKYRYRDNHIVINWGNSRRLAVLEGADILNKPEAVAIATNKLTAFKALEENGVPTVPFTTEKEIAEDWTRGGHKVFVRNELTGHSGEGIEVVKGVAINTEREALNRIGKELDAMNFNNLADYIYDAADELEIDAVELPAAPLYTLGMENRGEYRVHVFKGKVILYQKKSRRVDEETGEVITAEGEDADVRNLASNWIYRTGNLKRLERVEQLAIEAVEALGLDFGAVDILMTGDGSVYVLEVNTAPGLGNQDTLMAYVEAFNNLVE